MGGSLTYPYGSTSAVRGHVLAALGVLKVASADQIRRLMCSGHKDSKGVRNACLDLAKHGLTLSEGHARDGQKLWGLTPLGITAAAEALGRPVADMGGNARGAARSGAPHAMAVNETVIALTGTQPVPTRPIARTTPTPAPGMPAEAAAPAASAAPAPPVGLVVPAGFGSVASWATEVVHNLPGTSRTRPSVRTDAVLRAPEAGLPALLVEVDRCTEAVDVLAGKFARYHQYFRVKVKDPTFHTVHGGQGVPLWQSLYPPTGRDGYPPIAVVFDPGTRLGEQALKNRMNRVLDLTREHWAGTYKGSGAYGSERSDGYYEYGDAIPLLFTTLDRIQHSGPLAEVWWRCGHRRWETLTDALDNPRDARAWRRRDEERHKAQQAREARQREERRAAADEGWDRPRVPAQPEPEPPRAPCQTCGGPLGGLGNDDPSAPPPDGRNCASCRYVNATTQPPTGLFKALFGRPDKDTPPRPQAGP
ncbi:replication-relaxation family protein [Streptomyces sp. NBC_01455]|uniref:replication-relaxation family protein n=1 Tax=Streptomyces sp. NBC_01455 TaxID=2903874 RepID=UPI002E309EBD|nr:replication-relaxation family protein [Streptomyces sp. NBC_01455]